MVHALREAHRALKPSGLLIDLRPGPVHRRVGISRAGRWTRIGAMREPFDDDRAADRAVRRVLRNGWFKQVSRTKFPAPRVMDTLDEFKSWLEEFVSYGLEPHDWLVKRVAEALPSSGSYKIEVRGPLVMRVLVKQSPVRSDETS